MASWPKRTVDLARPLIVLAIFISGCAQQPVPREPQAQIDGGWEAYRLGDYAHAAQLFEAAEKSAGETHLQALYGLGSVWNLRRPGEDPAKAAEIYRKLIGEAPKHDLAAWSLLAIARMKHLVPVGEEPDLDAVRKAYQECIERFPDHLAGEEAFIYQESTYIAKSSVDDAKKSAEALEKFIATHGRSPFISQAWRLAAEAYRILKQPDKALAARINSVEGEELDPGSPPDQALTFWQIATMAEFDCGNFEVARKYYKRLMEQYPNDMKIFAAKTALKRMDEMEAKVKAELAGGSK